MECKKCGKSIDEYELYCNDCKELLRKEKELDELIIENKELNKLEITKEVETLQNFKDEQKETQSSLKEELKDLVNIEEIESGLSEKDNKKTIIIVASTISLICLIITIALLILFNKKEDKEISLSEKISYEEILNEYGKEVTLAISNYLKTNDVIPSWSIINDLIDYDKHEIACNVHSVYKDGSIYLSDCIIGDKNIAYSYGNKQEEVKEGKKVEIYKKEYDDYYTYTNNNDGVLELVGEISCKTDSCEYINAYDKFVLIKENNEYYLYNYDNGNIEFGPFDTKDVNMLTHQNKLYGVLYNDDEKINIYNVSTGKILKNLNGKLLLPLSNFNPNIIYKYGYVILKNDDKNSFVNLKTGNISYKIMGSINSFIEDNVNNIVYITTINSQNSKITIYNSNGKKLFNGKEYNDIQISNGKLIVANYNNFYVYNSKLQLETTSKDYNILGLYDEFSIVVNNENLELVDFKDNTFATFDLKWDNEKYSMDSILSGWQTEDEIKIIINDKETNKFFECYYNILTKDTKVTEITN